MEYIIYGLVALFSWLLIDVSRYYIKKYKRKQKHKDKDSFLEWL